MSSGEVPAVSLPAGVIVREDRAHLVVQQAVGGDDASAPQHERTAVETRDAAAGLLNDQDAAGDVPGVEPLSPEAAEPPGGDVAHVERGRPEPTHGARFREEAAEQSDHLV